MLGLRPDGLRGLRAEPSANYSYQSMPYVTAFAMVLLARAKAAPSGSMFLGRTRVLKKPELLKLLVALIRMNDSHALSTDEGLTREVCSPADRLIVRDLCELLIPIRRFYEYTESPEFSKSLEDKSPQAQSMMRKLASDPTKKRQQLERLDRALMELLTSDDVFQLVREEEHEKILKIVQLVGALSNPD